jgi:hypothetical protein
MNQHTPNDRPLTDEVIHQAIHDAGYEIVSQWSEYPYPWQMDLFYPAGIFAVLRLSRSKAVIEAGISYFASTPREWRTVHRVILGLNKCGLTLEENIPNCFPRRPPPHLLCVEASCARPPDYGLLCALLRSFTYGIHSVLSTLPGSQAY